MDGELGTTGPVRYRAATAVRPWIRRFLLLVLTLLCVLVATGGHPLLALLGLTGVVALHVGARRIVVELELAGDRLTLVTSTGRRTTIDLEEVDRIVPATHWRTARILMTAGRRMPLTATGALAPLLDLIDERRPGAVDEIRPVAAQAYRTEEKAAARRDRFPWLSHLVTACTVLGFVLMLGWLTAMVVGRNAILGRADAVEASVLAIEPVHDGIRATVEYRVEDEAHRAEVDVPTADRPETGGTLVIAVDPHDPDNAWAPGDRPVPALNLWAILAASVLLCLAILLAPTALAVHPVLTPGTTIDP